MFGYHPTLKRMVSSQKKIGSGYSGQYVPRKSETVGLGKIPLYLRRLFSPEWVDQLHNRGVYSPIEFFMDFPGSYPRIVCPTLAASSM